MGDQDNVVVSGASVSLPRPPQCSLWDDETWAILGEVRQRAITKIYETKVEFSEEYRRFLDEFVIGTNDDNPDCPDAPSNSEEGVQFIRPWRMFTDPGAQAKLLAMGNKYHKESQRKESEAMRRGEHFGSDDCNFLKCENGMVLRSGRHILPPLPPPLVEPMETLPATDLRSGQVTEVAGSDESQSHI